MTKEKLITFRYVIHFFFRNDCKYRDSRKIEEENQDKSILILLLLKFFLTFEIEKKTRMKNLKDFHFKPSPA